MSQLDPIAAHRKDVSRASRSAAAYLGKRTELLMIGLTERERLFGGRYSYSETHGYGATGAVAYELTASGRKALT